MLPEGMSVNAGRVDILQSATWTVVVVGQDSYAWGITNSLYNSND